MRNALCIAGFLVAATDLLANPIETWECGEPYSTSKEVLVKAIVNEGRKTGLILVAGITHETVFAVSGFDRRWDFGLEDDGTYKYSFVVRPNGDAFYYDFSLHHEDVAKATNFMKCKQVDSQPVAHEDGDTGGPQQTQSARSSGQSEPSDAIPESHSEHTCIVPKDCGYGETCVLQPPQSSGVCRKR